MSEFDPDAEVDGRYILSFVESAGEVSQIFRKKLEEELEKHGISDVSADNWYRNGDVSTAFDEVTDSIGDSTINQGGKEIGRTVPFPEDIDGPKAGFKMLNEMHKQAYRDSSMDWPAGRWTYEELSETTVRVGATEAYPYPVPLIEGVVEGVTEVLGPDTALINVEETTPNADEKAAFKVDW